MEYRLGNSKHILELGDTKPVTCPNCDLPVKFPIYKNVKLSIIPLSADFVYFTVCPECKKLFSLPHKNGSAFEKGDEHSVITNELETLKEFKI